MKPHKHAELIKAWADGAEIQIKMRGDGWLDVKEPLWTRNCQYRIKPVEKVVRWLWAYQESHNNQWVIYNYMTEEEAAQKRQVQPLKKLEWSREEFDE